MKYKLLVFLILGFFFISNIAIAETEIKADPHLQVQIDRLSDSLEDYLSAKLALEALKVPQVAIIPTIRDKVAEAFKDEPKMLPTIGCESNFRQFDSRGKPLRSPTSDVGVMQINQVHWGEAKKLGLDIFYSEDDNIKMGRIIYESQGLEAWTCSKKV